MTESQLQKLKSDAQKALLGIDIDNLNKSGYLLVGASLAILDRTFGSTEN